ncbi:hypothetical protein KEM54_005275 [Ascosphaera aggregata]|nr:hypothetical protein KEM54_005275 [Ascosphaera aggregata]
MWSSIPHHRETLQNVHAAHSELVNEISNNPMSTPVAVFHLEGFFERYTGQEFDGSHVKLTDLPIEESVDGLATYSESAEGPSLGRTTIASTAPISPRSQHALYTNGISGVLKTGHPSSAHASLPNASVQTQSCAMYQISQTLQPLSEQQPVKMTLPNAESSSTLHDQSSTTTADIREGYAHFAIPNATDYFFSPTQPITQQMDELDEPRYATFPFEPRHQPHLDPSHPFDPFSRPVGQQPTVEPLVMDTSTAIQIDRQQNGQADQSAVIEKDPFLSLLEQLVNEQNPIGGPNELDYFLTSEANTGPEHSTRDNGDKGTPTEQKSSNADASTKTLPGSLKFMSEQRKPSRDGDYSGITRSVPIVLTWLFA